MMHPAITERWLIELYRHLRNGDDDQALAAKDIIRAGYWRDDTVVWYTWQAIQNGTALVSDSVIPERN